MSPVPHGEDRDKSPDNPDDGQLNHLDPPDVVINADSSDSEDEAGGGYMGYQMLAQDVQENDSSDSEQNVSACLFILFRYSLLYLACF